MAALWDIIGKVANLVQLFGLDAITLITMVMSSMQFYENKRQSRKLEGLLQVFRALLQRPTGCWAVIQHSEMGDSVRKELKDADDLIESYKKSTLWSRLCRGRSTASQFCDIRIPVNDDGSGGMPITTGSFAGAEASSTVPDIHSQEGIYSDTGSTGDSTGG